MFDNLNDLMPQLERRATQYQCSVYELLNRWLAIDGKYEIEQLDLFAHVVREMPVNLLITDANQVNNSIIYANKACEAMAGYSAKELRGQNLLHFRNGDSDNEVLAILRDAMTQQRSCTVPIHNNRKDGTRFESELTVKPLINEQGQVTHLIAIYRDIDRDESVVPNSEKHQEAAEAAIKQSEARFRGLIETAPGAILLANSAGEIILVNARVEDLFGYTRDELIGQSIELLLPERFHEIHKVERDGYFFHPDVRPMGKGRDLAGRRKDGTEFPVEIGLSFTQTDNGILAVAFITNITDRKRAEWALAKQNEVLRILHLTTAAIGKNLEMATLLHQAMSRAVELLDADRGGGIYLFEETQNALRLVEANGINDGRVGTLIQRDEGVTGQVYQTAKPLIVNNYTEWNKHATVLVADPPSAVLGVPLFARDQVVGVLVVFANSQRRSFTADDATLAEMFATHVGIALGNAQLFDQAQREIAERKLAEAALRESEKRFRLLVENSPIGFYMADDHYHVIYANQRLAEMLGYSLAEIMQSPFTNFLAEEDRALLVDSYLHRRRGEPVPNHYQFSAIHKDGQKRWFDLYITSVVFPDGKTYTWGQALDITERFHAAEALQSSEERYRALIEQSPVAIVVSRNGICLYGNQKLLQMMGFKNAEEFVNHPTIDFYASAYRTASLERTQRRSLGLAVPDEFETVFLRSNGTEFPVQIVRNQIQLPDGLANISFITDITDRKRTEMALHQSETRLKQAVRVARLGIWEWNFATDHTEWYGEMFRIYGIKADEFTGKGEDYIHFTRADYKEIQQQNVKSIIEQSRTEADLLSGPAINADLKELCIVRPDGSECYTLGDAVVIADENGIPTRMLGVTFDITALKKIEKALRESEAAERDQRILAEALCDTAETLVATLVPDKVMSRILENVGKVVPHDWSSIWLFESDCARVAFTHGWSPEEEVELRKARLPLDAPGAHELLAGQTTFFISDTSTYPGWLVITKNANSYVCAAIRVRGQLIGFLDLESTRPGYFTRHHAERLEAFANQVAIALENAQLYDQMHHHADELELRVALRTAELQRSKEHVEAILENSPEGIVLLSPELFIRQANPAFDRLFAVQFDEYFKKPLADFFQVSNVREVMTSMQQLAVETSGQRLEVSARRTDGTVFDAELNIKYFPDGGLVCTISDITDHKHAEEILRQAVETEKELGELKMRFVSMASHEFRTPLAIIQSATETLSVYRQKLSEQQIEQKLTKIKGQVEHLTNLINDTLQLAQIQAKRVEFNPTRLDLDRLVQDVIDGYREHFDTHHQLIYSVEGLVQDVLLDKKLIRNAINNLISNAIKYSPPDSPVIVHLKFTPKEIFFSVMDQGIGIPENDKQRIFEPFHRASNVGVISGTGLGLVITKDSVEMHSGTLTFESQIGVGTTFIINIPLIS